MSKKAKIFISFVVFLLLVVLYLIFTQESVSKVDKSNDNLNSAKIEQLEEEYRRDTKEIFEEYRKLIGGSDYSIEQITLIKKGLLNLKVPTKFKDLHIELILALTKMEDYLTNGNETKKLESQQLINQIKANYGWLNN